MGKGQFVSVTHFINPQSFWYHKIDVPNEHYHQIIELEQQLLELFKNKTVASKFRPTVGDLVAVNFMSWNKCIRGRVEEIVQFRSTSTEYIVWAIDYGFPFQSKLDHLRYMPDIYAVHIDHIRHGGLAFLLPGEKEFDFMEGKAKMSIQDQWCQRACDSLEKLIYDAASVTFIEHFQTTKSRSWGDLKIVNHNGIAFLASDFLVGINMAVEAKTDFRQICMSLKCTQIPCWLSNNRNNKFKHNIVNCTVMNRRKNPIEKSCDDFSKQKVEDWCARNERFDGGESISARTATSTDCLIDSHDASIDEIGFEDSMSVKHEPLYKTLLDTQDLDEVEQGGFMRLGGMLTKSKSGKCYDIKNLPKPPTPSAFEISIPDEKHTKGDRDCGSSNSNSNSEYVHGTVDKYSASLHKNRLIEVRKKLASKQTVEMPQSTIETDSTSSTINNLEYQKFSDSTGDETASVSEISKKSERLLEIRKNRMKLLSTTAAAQSSKPGSAEESQSSIELIPSSVEKNNEVILQNVRAKQLIQMRRKYAASISSVTPSTKISENDATSTVSSNSSDKLKQMGGNQLKQHSNDKEDIMSNVSSGTTSSYMELLRNTREKRIRENKCVGNKPDRNDKGDTLASVSRAAAASCMDTLNNTQEKHTKENNSVDNEQGSNDKEDTMSNISIGAASSYIESLKNTRKKVQQRKLEKLQHVATTNEQPVPKFVDLNKDKLKKSFSNSNQKSSDPYDGITMLPAGFDLAKLCTYKDEENHWHRKKSTRNDVIPHDMDESTEPSQNKSTVSDDMWDWNESDDRKASKTTKQLFSSNQNFRHTRSHTDKFKEGASIASVHDYDADKQKNTKESEKSLLDSTVPKLSAKTLTPNITGCSVNDETVKGTPDTTGENLINLSSTVDDTPPREFSTPKSTSFKKYKRHSLKPPGQQMQKIERLLRHAQFEKERGNTEILDLDASNLNGRSDSDTNSGFDTANSENSTFLESQSSNSEYIGVHEEQQKDNLIKPIKKNETVDDSNHLKLEKLVQQLNSELGISNDRNCRTVETVIKLPQAQQIREISGESKLQTKFIDHMVLAHSKVPQNPLEKLSDAFLMPEIHEEMINMRVTKVYRIQAYSWPHLLRGNSLFVVNPIKSGKTWCYLPPICNLVSYRIQNSAVPQTYGPVAIIMAASARHVESVTNYCRRLVISSKIKITTVPAFGVRNSTDAKVELFNSCGILVATPANLVRLLRDNEKESLIDPERLQHFIVDDLDLILSRFKNEFDTAVRAICKMTKKPHQPTITLQIVITSRDWNSIMMSMIRWANQPLLLIGDFLEAAVYGKAAISVKLRSNEKKLGSVLRFIEQHPVEQERVLILCNCDDDMNEVVRALIHSGHACIGYGSDSGPEAVELRITIEEWKNNTLSAQILVCTDAALPDLKLRNAQCLIHYSMPTSWTKFTTRFATLAQSYENFVSTDFKQHNSSQLYKTYSLVLLDEENNMQLPRLIDFMKKHNQLKNIHANILAVSKRVLVEREELRIFKGTLPCPILLEFGECDETRCDYRHNLTRFDLITKKDNIPTEGDMRIQILKVFSPTWYSARLLEHKSPETTKWKVLRRSDEAALFGIRLNMHYMKMDNWIAHWPPKINDMCIYRSSETYQRARILDVPYIAHKDIVKVVNVAIKLIDLGTIISSCKSDELLVCDKQFRDFPAQAIDIRLMGVVPFDNERTWDSKATKVVQRWIMNNISDKECVHVNINFALANTVWVKNVIVMERLPTVGQYIYRVNLKRSLIHKNFGVCDNAVECRLKDLRDEVNKMQQEIFVEKQEIFVDEQESTEQEESINLMKFSSNDEDLLSCDEKQINGVKEDNNLAKEEFNSVNEKNIYNTIDIGKDGENWDKTTENHRNNWIQIPISSKSTINTPNTNPENQAKEILIQKNEQFKSKERWCKLPLNKMAGVEIGDENENGNWTDIYLQCIDEIQMQQFYQLNALITDHIKNMKKLSEKKPAFDSTWLQPKQDCIVKYDNLYCRAKIYGIFGKEIGQQIYRFFLCDYACFVTVNAEELFSDFLYETSCEIVEYTPYQAVHCKLAGITLKPFVKRYPVTKDYLYACAVQERSAVPGELSNFDILSYDILLYECEKANDFSSAKLFNMTLIDNNVATPDPKTKQYLEFPSEMVKTGANSKEYFETGKDLRDELVSFEEFLEIFNKMNEDDAEDIFLDSIDYDFKEKIQEIRETSIDSDLKERIQEIKETSIDSETICKKSMRKTNVPSLMEEENNDMIKMCTNDFNVNQSLSNGNDDQLISVSLSDSVGSANSTATVPLLKSLHKRPKTEWYETDCLIFLAIHAPDISDYYLQATKDTLYFAAFVNNEQQVLVLNFLGTIEPQHVSHEIRGLKVIVRLVKSIFMKWPRLLQQSTKFPWLSYNYNAIDLQEIDKIRPQQCMNLNRNLAKNDSEDDEVDAEEELYKTFTPIINSEDFHDPTADIF